MFIGQLSRRSGAWYTGRYENSRGITSKYCNNNTNVRYRVANANSYLCPKHLQFVNLFLSLEMTYDISPENFRL